MMIMWGGRSPSGMLRDHPALRLSWVSCIDPGLKPTEDGRDFGIAVMQ